MTNILLIGATSAIAQACARQWATKGARLFLVARDAQKLQQCADDLLARGAAAVDCHVLDLTQFDAQQSMIDSACDTLGQLDVVLLAHGTLPDQSRAEQNTDYALEQFACNASATIALMNRLAIRLEQQQHGALVVIASVAGDRGRPGNYLYGAAKSAVATFASGLRARLFKSGVCVTTIKPGFVATPMTAELDLPAALTSTPESIARGILKAVERRRGTVYLPGYWWLIMQVIKSIPEPLFKRLNLRTSIRY